MNKLNIWEREREVLPVVGKGQMKIMCEIRLFCQCIFL